MKRVTIAAAGLALAVVLAFGAGAFAHFVYPGPSETVIVHWQPLPSQPAVAPQVTRCQHSMDQIAQAQTQVAVAILSNRGPKA